MKGLYLVEPVAAFYYFSNVLIEPLIQQGVYRRLWRKLTNTTYAVKEISGCATNNSDISGQYEDVEEAAAMFFLFNDLCSLIPSLFTMVLVLACTDQYGRRIAILLPQVGFMIFAASCFAVSYFELSLNLLMVGSFFNGLSGTWGTMLGGCSSYIADVCPEGRRRTQRTAGMNMFAGVFSSAAFISSGYFLRATGFDWPFFGALLLQLVNLLYVVFVLKESMKLPEGPGHQDGRFGVLLLKLVRSSRHVFLSANRKKNAVLTLLLLTFMAVSFCTIGSNSVIVLYKLNEPLCWNEILIGNSLALSATNSLMSFAGVYVLSYCVSDLVIVLIGLLSILTGMAMTAFSKTTLLMLLGTLFAGVAVLETLSISMGSVGFNSLYAATVSWFPGFCFLVASGLCLISMILMGAVGLLGYREDMDTECLVS